MAKDSRKGELSSQNDQEVQQRFYRRIQPLKDRVPLWKRTPLHPYFTSQPASLIQAYLQRYCRPGDTVLDLFGGSGTTVRECALGGYRGIHVDLMPWSCFLARNSCRSAQDLPGIEKAFARLAAKVKVEISRLYALSDAKAAGLAVPEDFPAGIRLPASSDVETLEELFTPRNRLALMLLLREIRGLREASHLDFLSFVFSGILARASRTYWRDRKGNGGGDSGIFKVYRYWVPRDSDERQVWELFEARFWRVLKILDAENSSWGAGGSEPRIICGSATDLKVKIASDSVDYIYTDPPYAKHIAYLDLAVMYHAFLGLDVSGKMRSQEAIEGGDHGKSLDEYISLIRGSFGEAFRVLKPGRWMTVVFTHKNPEVYARLIDAGRDAGFDYVNSVAQDTKRPSFHKINNAVTVLRGQMMINFVKKPSGAMAGLTRVRGAEVLVTDAARLIQGTARTVILARQGKASFSEIVHGCYEKLLCDGYLQDFVKDIRSIEAILNLKFRSFVNNGELYFTLKEPRRRRIPEKGRQATHLNSQLGFEI